MMFRGMFMMGFGLIGMLLVIAFRWRLSPS